MNWIEIVGYIGSALVLVSFLMTSVFKLRVINTIGGTIFAIYALLIQSYPTAVMNIALVGINLHFLWKMMTTHREYEFVEVGTDDAFLAHELERWADDLRACFPGAQLDPSASNAAYIITYENTPAAVALGTRDADVLTLTLDYSLPAYRDFSVGKFFFEQLKQRGVKTVIYAGPTKNHVEYLKAMGFEEHHNKWGKSLI